MQYHMLQYHILGYGAGCDVYGDGEYNNQPPAHKRLW